MYAFLSDNFRKAFRHWLPRCFFCFFTREVYGAPGSAHVRGGPSLRYELTTFRSSTRRKSTRQKTIKTENDTNDVDFVTSSIKKPSTDYNEENFERKRSRPCVSFEPEIQGDEVQKAVDELTPILEDSEPPKKACSAMEVYSFEIGSPSSDPLQMLLPKNRRKAASFCFVRTVRSCRSSKFSSLPDVGGNLTDSWHFVRPCDSPDSSPTSDECCCCCCDDENCDFLSEDSPPPSERSSMVSREMDILLHVEAATKTCPDDASCSDSGVNSTSNNKDDDECSSDSKIPTRSGIILNQIEIVQDLQAERNKQITLRNQTQTVSITHV